MYRVRLAEKTDMDQGVGCILRAEQRALDTSAECHVIDLLKHPTYPCGEGEELVSHCIQLHHTQRGTSEVQNDH